MRGVCGRALAKVGDPSNIRFPPSNAVGGALAGTSTGQTLITPFDNVRLAPIAGWRGDFMYAGLIQADLHDRSSWPVSRMDQGYLDAFSHPSSPNMSTKTVLITGCTPGGIGHALSLECKRQGLHVFSTARKTETISDLASQGIETFALEATSQESVSNLVNSVSTLTNGQLDILINNAGRNYTVPALDVEIDEIEETFSTNVFAVMRLCKAFAPLLIQSRGTIVQIGSLAAVMPYVFGSVYNASKAALHAYSDTLRVELAPFGVRVVTVVTGGVKSNISRTQRSLPPDSLYLPLADVYERRQKHSQEMAIPNEQYARSVVRQLLNSPTRDTIWEGGKSWLVWFLHSFFPRWVMDIAMTRMFHLSKLKQNYSKKAA